MRLSDPGLNVTTLLCQTTATPAGRKSNEPVNVFGHHTTVNIRETIRQRADITACLTLQRPGQGDNQMAGGQIEQLIEKSFSHNLKGLERVRRVTPVKIVRDNDGIVFTALG